LQVSSWTLILLTSERFISVWFPFNAKQWCSRRRIIVVWSIISFILFGFNMHFFFTYDLLPVTSTVGNETVVHYHSCSFHDWFEDFMIGPWYWIDALLGDFIPFTIVFSGNCAIVTKIIASKRLRAVTAKDDKGSRKVRDVYCHHQWN